jgi:hypothetical protein
MARRISEPAEVTNPQGPRPRTLSQIEFVTLVQAVTGIDDAGFVALYENPALKGLWIKLRMATNGVNRDHPLINGGLDGLIAAEAITADDKAAILEHWPMEGDPV